MGSATLAVTFSRKVMMCSRCSVNWRCRTESANAVDAQTRPRGSPVSLEVQGKVQCSRANPRNRLSSKDSERRGWDSNHETVARATATPLTRPFAFSQNRNLLPNPSSKCALVLVGTKRRAFLRSGQICRLACCRCASASWHTMHVSCLDVPRAHGHIDDHSTQRATCHLRSAYGGGQHTRRFPTRPCIHQ